MIRVASLLAGVMLVGVASPAVADEIPEELFEYSLEELLELKVETASRKEEPLREAPAHVMVVTRSMIEERGYLSLTDVIRDLPGFDIATGPPAGEYPTHYAFRGISDVGQTKVLVMIDGRVINDVSNGWSHGMGYEMHLTDVERIEIVAGPGSVLYGANAYAGVINLITRKGSDHDAETPGSWTDARLMYGVNNTMVSELLYAHRFDNGFFLQLSGRHFYSDGDGGLGRPDPGGYFTRNVEPDVVNTTEHGLIPNERNPDGSRKAIPEGFNTRINDTSIRLRLEKDGLSAGLHFFDRFEGLGSEVVGYEYFANSELPYFVHHRGLMGYLQYDYEIAEGVEASTRATYLSTSVLPDTGFVYTYQYQSVDNGMDTPVADKAKGYHGRGYAVTLNQIFSAELFEHEAFSNSLLAGFLLEERVEEYFGISLGPQQDGTSTIVESTYPSEARSVQPAYFSTRFGVYLEDRQRFSDHYILSAGVRLDVDTEHDPVLNPRIGFVGNPWDFLLFKVIYGEAFKAPTVFELNDEWRGNPDLAPEKIRTLEVEVQGVLEPWVSLRFNGFINFAENLISVATNPDPERYPVGELGQRETFYQNIGARRIGGFSLHGDFEIVPSLTAYTNYHFLTQLDGGAVDNVARHKVNVGLNYRLFDWVNFNGRLNWVGPTRAPTTNRYFHPKDGPFVADHYDYVLAENPDGHAPSYVLTNLTITGLDVLPSSGVGLFPQLIVRNVLNADIITLGRQSGSGTRPLQQPRVPNPEGFIPAYHPQAPFEIFFRLRMTYD